MVYVSVLGGGASLVVIVVVVAAAAVVVVVVFGFPRWWSGPVLRLFLSGFWCGVRFITVWQV